MMTQDDIREMLADRQEVLSSKAEHMISLLRFHVQGCEPCKNTRCGQEMLAFLDGLNREMEKIRDKFKARFGNGTPS